MVLCHVPAERGVCASLGLVPRVTVCTRLKGAEGWDEPGWRLGWGGGLDDTPRPPPLWPGPL